MSYKHGIYTESVNTLGKLTGRSVGTVPVYIGTAPVHTLATGVTKPINVPVLINSYSDFVSTFGYSDDWDKFTLCEAAYAHFRNDINAIAPIICINILDPVAHQGTTAGTVDVTKVAKTDFEKGLAAIDTAIIRCGIVPNIIVAPKYSYTYAAEILAKCTDLIDKKWGCVGYIDIPDTNATIATAITAKTTALTSKLLRMHYPKAKYGDKVFHLSVLDAVTSQVVDSESDGVACHSSSNRRVMCDVPVRVTTSGATTTINEFIYSETDANNLNQNGITTLNYIGGSFRLWGGHMANYNYNNIATIEAKDRSDATVRMQIYLDNWLKREFIDNIDRPLARRDIDNIIANVNIALNSFVNSGYLLKGECYFDGGSNATGELADGDLVLDILHTEVPNGKSISFKMQYDVSGLNALYATEEV